MAMVTQPDTRAELAELLKRRNELTVRFLAFLFKSLSQQTAFSGGWALFREKRFPSPGKSGQLRATNLCV